MQIVTMIVSLYLSLNILYMLEGHRKRHSRCRLIKPPNGVMYTRLTRASTQVMVASSLIDLHMLTEWTHSKSGAIKQGHLQDAALSIFLSQAFACRRFSVENKSHVQLCTPDMVGHIGVYDATVKTITATDKAVGTIYDACEEADASS